MLSAAPVGLDPTGTNSNVVAQMAALNAAAAAAAAAPSTATSAATSVTSSGQKKVSFGTASLDLASRESYSVHAASRGEKQGCT